MATAVFVAIDDPMGTGSGIANTAARSSNGIGWTANTLPSSQTRASLNHGNGLFVAIATLPISLGGTNVEATSPDGMTWTPGTLPDSLAWTSVTCANGTFVAISGGSASSTPAAATSPDRVTWTPQTAPSSLGYVSVAYENGTLWPSPEAMTTLRRPPPTG